MTRGDWQRPLHIRTYCEDIEQFIDRFGRDFDTFTSDRAYFSAVAMRWPCVSFKSENCPMACPMDFGRPQKTSFPGG